MKFSVVNGERREAQPAQSGSCPVCGQETIAKCGDVRLWHWAHKGRRACDPWWEGETEWHRAWKGQFPEAWQEVVHYADNGERHIADVKTDQGWVVEFQHSYLDREERQSRDAFYPKLVWVVNGVRRKRDAAQFRNALNRARPIGGNARIRIPFVEECAILREWAGSRAPVFIDFGAGPTLWWILAGAPTGSVDVAPFSRSELISVLREGATQKAREFEEFVCGLRGITAGPESLPPTSPQPPAISSQASAVLHHPWFPTRRSRRL